MHPLFALLLVPVVAAVLLWLVIHAFAWFNRVNDRAGVEEARKCITALGFEFEKCNVGSSWFVVHFQSHDGAAKARFRYNRQTGITWEKGTLEKSISLKRKKG